MIDNERIRRLNNGETASGQYVLYWMQASQRAECNPALEYAVSRANELKQPLLVYFGLTDGFPEANERHYAFMLEGLNGTFEALRSRGISTIIRHISPETGAVELAGDASLVVCDRGYLRIQRQWRQDVAEHIGCPLIQLESDVVVPVETASNKEEYSAATLRRKLVPQISRFLTIPDKEDVLVDGAGLKLKGLDLADTGKVLAMLEIDRSVHPVREFQGGEVEAAKLLRRFIEEKLDCYADRRNDPNEECELNLSPYLHFGQISPVQIALEVQQAGGPGAEAFLEQLIVRREVAVNYVFYNGRYDEYTGLPEWARRTLEEHRSDVREYVYPLKELEQAGTHDNYWNAAQRQMVQTGKMHNYMRMYWGKKILEWSATPEEAFNAALYLNNKYELDGRDPNGFTGVAWCFGKHDRPWAGRPVFGNIRYMNANGLRRKFDADAYAERYGG